MIYLHSPDVWQPGRYAGWNERSAQCRARWRDDQRDLFYLGTGGDFAGLTSVVAGHHAWNTGAAGAIKERRYAEAERSAKAGTAAVPESLRLVAQTPGHGALVFSNPKSRFRGPRGLRGAMGRFLHRPCPEPPEA